jgi:hypothetical protein
MKNKFTNTIERLKGKVKVRNQIALIDPEWTKQRFSELGIDRQKLMDETTLDKSTVSLIFSSKRRMTKSIRIAIYYYVAYQELLKQTK